MLLIGGTYKLLKPNILNLKIWRVFIQNFYHGMQAFSVAGPDIWNSLPATIRTIDSHPAFRRALKTHLFRSAFDIDIVMHNRSIFNLYDWAL